MIFKNTQVRKGFERPHVTLIQLAAFAVGLFMKRGVDNPVMTDSFRSRKDQIEIYADEIDLVTDRPYRNGPDENVPHSVHSTMPVRGCDFRAFYYQRKDACAIVSYNDEIKRNVLIAEEINKVFTYDPDRPNKKCCLFHKLDSGAWHFHLQVSDETVRREE